jgi:hypothetical protein
MEAAGGKAQNLPRALPVYRGICSMVGLSSMSEFTRASSGTGPLTLEG